MVTLEQINARLKEMASTRHVELEIMQSNHEGEIVDKIGNSKAEKIDAILINPAAYTHTSVAIRDAIASVSVPTIEVHLSNIHAREEFRKKSLCAEVCHGQIVGLGANSYYFGFEALVALLNR